MIDAKEEDTSFDKPLSYRTIECISNQIETNNCDNEGEMTLTNHVYIIL